MTNEAGREEIEDAIFGLELDLDYHRKYGFPQTAERIETAIACIRRLSMTLARARELLGAAVRADGSLYTYFTSRAVSSFTPDELKAIAWWMENNKGA